MMLLTELKISNRVSSSRGLVLFSLVAFSVLGCAVEAPARRSAVDASRLCSNDPERPVFAGQCLRTAANANVNQPGSERYEPSGNPPGDLPSPTPTELPSPTPTQLPRELPEPKGSVVPSPSQGGGGPAGAPSGTQVDPDSQDAKSREALAEMLKGIGEVLIPVLKGTPKGGQPSDGGDGEGQRPAGAAAASSYILTFSQPSFVGIADGVVVKNCLIAKGTKIEVKTEPQKITEFVDLGVNQFVTGEVLQIVDSTDSCGLKGRDIIYLGSHADFVAKPE